LIPKTHWLADKNWGDAFTPFLFEEGFGVEVEHAASWDAELFSCGSLIDRVPDGFQGHILGSGIGFSETRKDLTRVQGPLLLRGKLTSDRCKSSETARFGDPGILASLFVSPHIRKKRRYGVIPHYVDKKNEELEFWVECKDALYINIEGGIRSVIQAVASCEVIVSSSLHGLVIADSLGIPNKWVKLSDKLLGDGLKFRDYYTAYGEYEEPALSISDGFKSCRSRDVSEVKQAVLEAFQEYVVSL
jgi:pyruvyltransferase